MDLELQYVLDKYDHNKSHPDFIKYLEKRRLQRLYDRALVIEERIKEAKKGSKFKKGECPYCNGSITCHFCN